MGFCKTFSKKGIKYLISRIKDFDKLPEDIKEEFSWCDETEHEKSLGIESIKGYINGCTGRTLIFASACQTRTNPETGGRKIWLWSYGSNNFSWSHTSGMIKY
jgi:hypothetical protein